MKNLKEILENYKVTELREIAKNSGIKGYSKLKKAEIIDIIIKQLSDVDISVLDLPDEIKKSVNANAENVAANLVAAINSDSDKEKTSEIDSENKFSDDNIIKLKTSLFGVAPHVTNIIPEDMPVPPSKTPESFMQIKKIYPNDKCPCGSGKKYKKCCGRIA